ncbi:hypothetical protein CN230_29100 [Sinorhizobium meliloti]|uniref:glycosyltransferase family 8 protein n=1 Tax=Rhizobium meliloti TaxID=382 RepID=UPI000FD994E6|nr:glycosyltransferase family 8 protein [Sinorhizobium meliloti]RVG03963.1 hypothetical protein CN230_29100 [Sinorhizobium meliloti]
MQLNSVIVASSNIAVSEINFEALPRDATIIRCGNFYDEELYSLGAEVDYCTISEQSEALIKRLAQVAYSGAYTIKNYLYAGDTNNKMSQMLRRQPAFKGAVDCLSALSEHPQIARFFMSGTKPALPLQMLAWALIHGCDRAYLIAPEIYGEARHFPFVEPTYTQQSNQPHVEQRDQTAKSIDHAFIAMLMRAFPKAHIFDGTTRRPANMPFGAAPQIPSHDRLAPMPKVISAAGRRGIDEPQTKSPYYAHRLNAVTGKDERCAYVTFCDSEAYLFGARVLANGLAKHSQIPLIVMTPSDFKVSGSKFQSPYVRILPVPRIRSPHVPEKHQARFENTYTKLNVFGLDFLDKAIFLDSDIAILRNIEDLFDIDGFAAAPDHGLRLMADDFNSGVFVCQPSSNLYLKLLENVSHVQSYDGGDQGFLNEMFPDRVLLPHHFNVLKRVEKSLPALFDEDKIAALHFVGEKPWSVTTATDWSHLDRLWFEMLGPDESIDFILWLKSQYARQPVPKPPKPQPPIPVAKRAPSAEELLDMGKYQEALKAVAPILKENPRSVRHLRLARDAYLGKRQYIRALKKHLRLRKVQRQRYQSN